MTTPTPPTITAPATPLVPVRLAPSQTRHPWQATLRTVLAGVIGLASLAPDVLAAAHVNSTVLGVQALGVAAVVTRIIAIPRVNELLTKLGLGAEPKA